MLNHWTDPYRRPLMQWARLRLPTTPTQDLEDIVQDLIVACLNVPPPDHPKAYLRRALGREIARWIDGQPDQSPVMDATIADPRAEAALQRVEDETDWLALLPNLDPQERAIALLGQVEELRVEDMASLLEWSKRRVERVRQRLRRHAA